MPTLDEARAEVGRLSQGLGFVAVPDALSASGATADTWQDGAWLADATRGGQFYVRSYLLRTASGLADSVRARRVAAFDPTLGKLTVTPHWGVVPAAGEPYEAGWRWHPLTVEAAIRRVHGRMYTPVEFSLPSVPAQLQYGLTDATGVAQYASQVERITARIGGDGQRVTTQLSGALVRQLVTDRSQQLVVDLVDGPLRTDDTLTVRTWQPYQSVTPLTDGPSTTPAPLAWLCWETIYSLLQQPQMNLDDDLRQQAAREVRQLRKGSAPPPQGPLFRDADGSWGSAGAGRY